MTPRDIVKKRVTYKSGEIINLKHDGKDREYTEKYPKTILTEFSNASQRDRFHPTQKPVALCEYLIKTYTNEGEWVLDNCMGSGTTGVACINTNRNFIGIEQEEKYFTIAKDRLEKAEESAIQQHITQKLAIGG
jgi:DNA modification methylase